MKTNHSLVAVLATNTPPDLGPGPRSDVQSLRPLQAAIDEALRKNSLPTTQGEVARALVLLWHDHHEPAHTIVQDLSTADASYVHAILHRREPDFGNAKYWFRRVGTHSCHPALAHAAGNQLQDPSFAGLRSKLLPGGNWDAFAFVDACEAASAKAANPRIAETLREIQATEFRLLLESLTKA